MTAKARRINLGLAIASSIREPGECLAPDDIAAFCDCSPLTIRHIEKKALAKLKGRLKRVAGDELKEWTRG
jgi:hypothetical protein